MSAPDDALKTFFAPAERADLESLHASAALIEAMGLLRVALDAVPEPVMILNQQRQAVYVNETGRDALGLEDWHDVLGDRPGEILDCRHAHDMPGGCGTSEACTTCGAVRAILAGIRGQVTSEECRITLNNGEALDFRMWARPFSAEGQEFVICSIQDISNEKRRRTLERIFFHDVLNTAAIVSTYTQLLEISQEDVDLIVRELHHASERLIDEIKMQQQLLAAESSELRPHAVLIDVRDFMEDLAMQYERRASAQARYSLRLVHWPEPIHFVSDVVLLRRVISNMIKNALEASADSDAVTMSYELDEVQNRVIFSVHNPAVMPRHAQLQIFNRSFSTKGEGRGLGTYSMKLLSERYLHGRVWFQSQKGAGTTFYAAYPLDWPEG
jgi:signal transduction histidine kinase